ncbi:MAG: hypothetical protein JXR19_06710 [Bacteroidia bacterium]
MQQVPAYFGEVAAEEYTRVLSQAINLKGWVSTADLGALEIHCLNYETLFLSMQSKNEDGDSNIKRLDRLEYKDLFSAYKTSVEQFGLSPSHRTSIDLKIEVTEEDDDYIF